MANSTRGRASRNPQSAKPYPGFPLTAHPTGRWCKKVRGKIHYFGPIADPQAALALWLEQKDELLAGRVPRTGTPRGHTLADLANAFLSLKQSLVHSRELSPRTFECFHRACASLLSFFGRDRLIDDVRQEDFAAYRSSLASRLGHVSVANQIQRTRSVFRYALESGMLKTPVLFGPGFKRPNRKTLRLERAKKGPMLFERDEIFRLLAAAGIQLRAMILLAANAGLGNSDLSNMPLAAVNLETGWVDYPRPKTGIARRFPLWPESLEALNAALAKRPKPKNEADAGLLFITKHGARWDKTTFAVVSSEIEGANPLVKDSKDSAITKEFAKLMRKAGVERRKGRGFYALRHNFETIAGESRDQVAVDHVMGHAREDMASVYRERISDERLSAVVTHVRDWLFGSGKGGAA